MADVDLHLKDLTVSELIAQADRVAAGLDGNAYFPTPQPSIEELRRIIAELEASDEELRQQRLRLNDLKTVRDTRMKALEAGLEKTADYVQEASEGDARKIMSANLQVEHRWRLWPFGSVNRVVELSASMGDEPGEVDLVWDPIRGADGYEAQLTRDFCGEEAWENCAATTQSKVTIANLVSRTRYWFRVRAVGQEGEGDWSDPVTKYAR